MDSVFTTRSMFKGGEGERGGVEGRGKKKGVWGKLTAHRVAAGARHEGGGVVPAALNLELCARKRTASECHVSIHGCHVFILDQKWPTHSLGAGAGHVGADVPGDVHELAAGTRWKVRALRLPRRVLEHCSLFSPSERCTSPGHNIFSNSIFPSHDPWARSIRRKPTTCSSTPRLTSQ